MKSNLEIIREKVIEVVPEILELKFGCRVKIDGTIYSLIDNFRFVGGGGYNGEDYDEDDICDINELISFGAKLEIIGRPIQLSDVLRAIGDLNKGNKVNDFNKLEYGIGVDSFWIGNSITHQSMDWDLSKPLEEQNTEVLEFLVQLLVNK